MAQPRIDRSGRAPSPPQAALGGLLALAVAIGIGRFVYTPILPPMIAALGLSGAAAGLIASANFLGYLAGALLAAMPTLPGPRRAWLFGALTLTAVATGAMGMTRSVPAFLLLRFIGGGASAFVLILASTMVLEVLGRAGRPGLAALHFAGVGSGIAVSALLVTGLLQAGQDWSSLWLWSGLLSLLGSLGAIALLRSTPEPAPASTRGGAAGLRGGLLRLVLAYGLFGFGYIITATFLVAIVRRTPAISPLEPLIWIVFGLAAAPSVALWNRMAGRVGLPAAFAVACIAEAVGVLASVGWQTEAGVVLAAVLVGGTFMGLTALGLMQARNLAGGEPRRALALMTGAFGLGQIVGPSFAGALSDRLGSFTLPSLVAVAALVVAAALAYR